MIDRIRRRNGVISAIVALGAIIALAVVADHRIAAAQSTPRATPDTTPQRTPQGPSQTTAQTASEGRVVERYGAWTIRCEKPLGAPLEECALVQNVEAADRPNVSLTVVFLETADGQARILRILAPHGVLLPRGLGLSIDDQMIGFAEYMRCLQGVGCIAEVALDAGLLERFEAGTSATFVIFLTGEEGIGIPIPLDGFARGFEALKDPPPAADRALAERDAPRDPVETSTRVLGATGGSSQSSPEFEIPNDPRTALDRLLEDELFPIVAAVAGALILALVGGIALILRGLSGRRRRARAARGGAHRSADGDDLEDEDDEADDEPADGTDDPDEDLAEPRRPSARRGQKRLAASSAELQVEEDPLDALGEVVIAQTGRGGRDRPAPTSRESDPSSSRSRAPARSGRPAPERIRPRR